MFLALYQICLVIFHFFFQILRSCFLSLNTLNISVLYSVSDIYRISILWGFDSAVCFFSLLSLEASFCALRFLIVNSITWNNMYENPLKLRFKVHYSREALNLFLVYVWGHCHPRTFFTLNVCVWERICNFWSQTVQEWAWNFLKKLFLLFLPLPSLLIIISFFCSWGDFLKIYPPRIWPFKGMGFNRHTLCMH